MGCIMLAFFKIEKGIFYGGKSDEDSLGGGELLGIQLLGCLVITLWSGGLSTIFFYISMKAECLRLSEQDEILGGDLHYFGPIQFEGNLSDYDL
jgi:ammonia channel protein AmtB